MSELSPETRSLLDAARDAHAAPTGARDRVRARMMSDLARSVPPKPVSARWFQSSLVKLAGAGVVIVGLGTALRVRPSPTPTPAVHRVARVTPQTTPTPVPRAVPVVPTPASAPAEPLTQPVLPEAPPSRSRAVEVRGASDDLTAEIALLRQARGALARHDNATALDLAERYQTRFPQGSMAEDAAALKVIALCQSGLTQRARAEAERFFARWPRSLHGSRVRTACHHGAIALGAP